MTCSRFTVMPENPLIVPTILISGALHFAEVTSQARAKDVISALLSLDGVKSEILGDLEEQGWALQRIRTEQNGRPWEEDELDALGDGLLITIIPRNTSLSNLFTATLNSSTLISPLLNIPSSDEAVGRQFSFFPMTGHMHSPILRLVSRHPQLSLMLTFLRVPEIHDEFEYNVFLSRTMVITDVINLVVKELGLTQTLPISGGGKLEYVLEESWVDGDLQSEIPSYYSEQYIIPSCRICSTTCHFYSL